MAIGATRIKLALTPALSPEERERGGLLVNSMALLPRSQLYPLRQQASLAENDPLIASGVFAFPLLGERVRVREDFAHEVLLDELLAVLKRS